MKIIVLTDNQFDNLRDILESTYTYEWQVDDLEHTLDMQEAIQKDMKNLSEIANLIETFHTKEVLP